MNGLLDETKMAEGCCAGLRLLTKKTRKRKPRQRFKDALPRGNKHDDFVS